MNKFMYSKLALSNIKKNKNMYFPFLLAAMVMASLFYILTSITVKTANSNFSGAREVSSILYMGIWCIGFFSILIIFYINSFLMKRRTRELGLYNVLGMDKKHIGKVLFWETFFIGIGSIVLGIFFGALLAKLMFLILIKLAQIKTPMEFSISGFAIILTSILFGVLFILLIIYNRIRVIFLKPIELLHSTNVGEREPKAKWIITLLGLGTLGTGYYIAMTCKNVMEALSTFLIAVILVIIGTYLLFTTVSIAVLKIMKSNKRYYYHKTHFITISGMIYRMKKNAAGLASICILSTMVLVTLSTTVSLYMGLEDMLKMQYDRDIVTSYNYEPNMDKLQNHNPGSYDTNLIKETMERQAEKHNVKIDNVQDFYMLNLIMQYNKETHNVAKSMALSDINNMSNVIVMNLDDYNKLNNSKETLGAQEAIILTSEKSKYDYDTILIKSNIEKKYTIKKKLTNEFCDSLPNYYVNVKVLVVPTLNEMEALAYYDKSKEGSYRTQSVTYNYKFDLSGSMADKKAFIGNLRDVLNDAGIAHVRDVRDIYSGRENFMNMYGSLLFIGVFLGILFLITTVMIIYYKQISEGYEDRSRFDMMKKVGMGDKEVKKVIHSQILTVFFLPIIVAIVHICFAFRIIRQLLLMLGLTKTSLFIICTVGTVLIFTIAYGIVYALTAKTYYKLVNKANL
ncbi:putative ABC transport system permease protein [Hathewaya proteolytica DSM 3090]|uniref:Putative ABC transport system permease protein n=1 Tax=Hathewaya proteolytica DSM 3090 TaxID=1121331 RepID=A0A1M6QYH8_9CLOT|nr:ABC transporter permease [Hathewaya proteolytica]SHK25200.1 putative ABC transport system permease protein [Hathewaya proteolytica DSM 3090]